MKKLSGFLLLFVFLCCSLSAKETQIIIFSTNDMHGSIDNFAKIASYIQKERAKNPRRNTNSNTSNTTSTMGGGFNSGMNTMMNGLR